MNEHLIEFRNVHYAYETGRQVLQGVDFQLQPGERVALVGDNGVGKTTLLHMMVGLLRPRGGEVFALGGIRRKEEDFVEVRRKVGLLFQDPEDQLFCPTVAEDVAFGPLNLGASREKALAIVRNTLADLGLQGFEDRVTHKLSSGEKRLVSLAAVLAMHPDVLLLDEPTNGLDERAMKRVEDLIPSLPHTMVVVSHDRRLLERVATRTVQLKEGRIENLTNHSGRNVASG